MADLKPCPFCGADAVEASSTLGHSVSCSKSDCSIPVQTTATVAARVWNSRFWAPHPDRPGAQILCFVDHACLN